MYRPGSRPPVQWLRTGEGWPEGELQSDAPVEAIRAQHVVRALAKAIAERNLSGRQAAGICGVDQRTVSRLLRGASYADISTLARLEAGLGVPLWPGHSG